MRLFAELCFPTRETLFFHICIHSSAVETITHFYMISYASHSILLYQIEDREERCKTNIGIFYGIW